MAAPHAYPLAEPDPMSLIAGPWRGADSLLLIALGLLGLATALGIRRAVAPRLLIAGAALQLAALRGIAADARALTLLGYPRSAARCSRSD